MQIEDEIARLLGQVGRNAISPTAYDTAWVATLRTRRGEPRFPASLEWLRSHQHPDGSWGASSPGLQVYYHDRLLATLRAVLTLQRWGAQGADRRQITRGLEYIRRHAPDLAQDPIDTVGFELIFPTLLAEAAAADLPLPYGAFRPVQQVRAAKLARAPLHLAYYRHLPLATSLEALGQAFHPAAAAEVQEPNGSVGTSPAATAFLLEHWPDNAPALAYLESVAAGGDGGIPAFSPMETMERSWVLYHLQHACPDLNTRWPALVQPVLEVLRATAEPTGWTASAVSSVKESDTTAVCYALLRRAGYDLDPQLLYQYEEAEWFRCYPLERNPSISANAHILDALHTCDPGAAAPRVAKVLRFLRSSRHPAGYWFDKWHVSPYYVTSQVILAAHDWAPDLVAPAIAWLLRTQDPSGGWGYYAPTSEETAYAVLALHRWQGAGHPVPAEVLHAGASYLATQVALGATHTPPLWIGKALYAPVQIVQAVVWAALLASNQAGGSQAIGRRPGERDVAQHLLHLEGYAPGPEQAVS